MTISERSRVALALIVAAPIWLAACHGTRSSEALVSRAEPKPPAPALLTLQRVKQVAGADDFGSQIFLGAMPSKTDRP